jgi:threonine dehydrogenase-like Zn-dependent dehydrogenase
MRGLYFDGTLRLDSDLPLPEPDAGETVIAPRLAGICHTDLELTRGYLGFKGVLGHEFVGQLLQDAGPWRAGQRVVGDINVADGQCEMCRAGVPSQCLNHRRTLGIFEYDGVFAERFKLPLANLHAVPDSVPDEHAVFAEPLAAAFNITQLVHLSPTDRVLLIGAGKLGLLCAQVLKLAGCDLTAIVRRPHPMALLHRWGIAYVNAAKADWQGQLKAKAFDVVVDATGTAEGFAMALEYVRPRGTIVLKSTYVGLPQADLTRVVIDEIRIIGSRCGPFDAALRALAAGIIDVESMIDAYYPLEEAIDAFEHAARPGVLKILLRP